MERELGRNIPEFATGTGHAKLFLGGTCNNRGFFQNIPVFATDGVRSTPFQGAMKPGKRSTRSHIGLGAYAAPAGAFSSGEGEEHQQVFDLPEMRYRLGAGG